MHNKNAHAYFRRAFAYKALGMFEQSAQDFETAKVPLAPPPQPPFVLIGHGVSFTPY
jgi:hypothetical protein